MGLCTFHAWAEEQAKRKLEDESFHWVIENAEGVPVGTIDTHHCDLRNGTFSYGLDIAPSTAGKATPGKRSEWC